MNNKNKLPKSVKIEKAKKICKLYAKGEYTIAACCKAVGVEYNTFQGWAQPNLSKEDILNGNYRRGFVQVVHDLYKKAVVNNNINYKSLLKDTVWAFRRYVTLCSVAKLTTCLLAKKCSLCFSSINKDNYLPISI